MTSKPTSPPKTPFPETGLHQQGDYLWLPLKNEWRNWQGKPEEVVRQEFIRHLCTVLDYEPGQIGQELKTQSGTRSSRADIAVWASANDKVNGASPKLVVECKAESVGIDLRDYYQGESYARAAGAEFFIAHNRRFTEIFRVVPALPGEFVAVSEIPKAGDWGDAKRMAAIKAGQRAFNRSEFTKLLRDSHNILRNVHKMEPGIAFDTISKILFIKMFVERAGLHGTFTTDYLDRRNALRLPGDAPLHEQLFAQTKNYYKADHLFTENDKLDISDATFRRIIKVLQSFDLAKTSDDIKGIAFERFLGDTFRGDLGQYFTPRPVVDFMVDLVDPKEGQLVCDPAAGSGGFLIRAFEHVRESIIADVQQQKDKAKAEIEAKKLSPDAEAEAIEAAFLKLNEELLPSDDQNQPVDTRVGRLAWRCIFGTDAEPRAARTAKMNMIMHGDGHGGIHHHDGLVDVNGIFPDRFDAVITNPPFGSSVGRDQRLGDSAETQITADATLIAKHRERYGETWEENHKRLTTLQGARTPVLDLFEIGKDKANRATEVIFVERCLNLLKPGGTLAIVLPDGNLNNPSLDWLRRWTEGRAKLRAIISLPEETFRSSKATVKCSVVVMSRFTEAEEKAWKAAWKNVHKKHDAAFDTERSAACTAAHAALVAGGTKCKTPPEWVAGDAPAYPRAAPPTKLVKPSWAGSTDAGKAAARALTAELKAIDARHTAALWATVRDAFDYPVFVAAPKAVGISSTGETGDGVPNDLPAKLAAWREFSTWLENGAESLAMPSFAA